MTLERAQRKKHAAAAAAGKQGLEGRASKLLQIFQSLTVQRTWGSASQGGFRTPWTLKDVRGGTVGLRTRQRWKWVRKGFTATVCG